MRKILWLFCLAVSSAAFGQSSNQHSKFSFGFSVSPDYSFRVPFNYGNETQDMINDVFYEIEIPQPGLTTGLNVVYSLTPRVELQAGLLYSYRRIKYKQEQLLYYCDFTGDCPDGLARQAQLTHRQHFMEIPLKANFLFGNGRLKLVLGAGGSANLFLRNTTKQVLKYEDGRIETTVIVQDLYSKRLSFSPLVSVGGKYEIDSNSYLKVEPTLIAEPPLRGYLWRSGLNIGYYRFF